MTNWKPVLTASDEPMYVTIAAALARDIESGRIAPGTRLPTHRDLARNLKVNVGTITRAYAEAARRGLVDGEVGRGSFVRHPAARGFASVPPSEVPAGVIDLAFNLPSGGPTAAERSAALRALAARTDLDDCFNGYHLAGLPSHREAGAKWLATAGVTTDAERVLVTGGAQHALAVALATAAQPGETVLAESLTYTGLKSLSRLLGLRLQPVAIDEHGLLPEAFEAACHGNGVKALYIQSTSQNPTAVTLSAERRDAIVAVARKHGVAIVEDDTYGFVGEGKLAPLAARAPERTYYLTTLAKSVSSGLRVGYLVPPSEPAGVLERAIASVMAIGWTAAPLTAELASQWILDGVAQRAASEKRAEAKARQQIARRILAPVDTQSEDTSCHLWLHLPDQWRASEFVVRARRAGVAVTAAEAFVVGRGAAPHAVRLCISTPATRAELERALHALAHVLRTAPDSEPTLV